MLVMDESVSDSPTKVAKVNRALYPNPEKREEVFV
jgi:hypothetical protein